MTLKQFTFLLFFFTPFFTKAQNHTFHKVLNLPNQFVERPNNIKFLNNTYYITGHAQPNSEINLLYLTLDTMGNILNIIYNEDTAFRQVAGFSQSKLDTIANGNFFIHYTKRPKIGNTNKHERVELEKTGQIINKISLDTLNSTQMSFRDFSRIVIDNANHDYYTLNNILPCDTCQDNAERIVLAKFSQTTNELSWMKKWSNDTTNSIFKDNKDLLLCTNGDVIVVYNSYRYGFFYPINYQHSKINFERYSPSGALVSQKTIQPHSYSWSSYGGTFVENEKGMVVCYTNSTAIYPGTGPDYWELKPTVAKLDSHFNVVWQKNLGGIDYNPGNLFPDRLISNFEVVGDTSTVGAHFFVDTLFNGFLRIEKRKIANGELDWERRYCYTAPGVVDSMVLFDIGDVEKTPDGGFVIIGQAEFYDSFNVSPQYLYGYVMKTNCLGFLGDPSANFTSIRDTSFGVNFTNTSLMGGSYLWDFGDGTSLFTGENMGFDASQPIFHQYSDTGKYSVSLIAYGCNGVNDTLRYTIHIIPEQIINPNVTNYIALGPNPVKSGESISVYVGNLPSENCSLSFYDYQGKLVSQNKLHQSKSTYIVPLSWAVGTYQVVLRNGEVQLEIEKIVVY